MNATNIEIGWIIIPSLSEQTLWDKLSEYEDETGCWIPDGDGEPAVVEEEYPSEGSVGPYYVETHPEMPSRIFVSLCTPEHGFNLEGQVEPRDMGACLRDYIACIDPDAAVTFGIIVTER
jgi:hypothetical protein